MKMKTAITCIKSICKEHLDGTHVNRYGDKGLISEVIEVISGIDEPQKVVVPKEVAEWIVECKSKYYSLRHAMEYANLPDRVNKWLLTTFPYGYPFKNQDTFARAWLEGYEVEEEQLYTVRVAGATLTKITRGIEVQYRMIPFGDDSLIYTGDSIYTTHLTEDEIKGYDKRLWQFAVPVEEK